tara:strand:- start:1625 stop:1846 length:222 start_codon:yes stop_codon:yes gene_type:complete
MTVKQILRADTLRLTTQAEDLLATYNATDRSGRTPWTIQQCRESVFASSSDPDPLPVRRRRAKATPNLFKRST